MRRGVIAWTLALIDIDRFHWSDAVPPMIRLPAMVVFAAGALLAVRAMIANRFFSVAVRIQNDRGHHVVSGGPTVSSGIRGISEC